MSAGSTRMAAWARRRTRVAKTGRIGTNARPCFGSRQRVVSPTRPPPGHIHTVYKRGKKTRACASCGGPRFSASTSPTTLPTDSKAKWRPRPFHARDVAGASTRPASRTFSFDSSSANPLDLRVPPIFRRGRTGPVCPPTTTATASFARSSGSGSFGSRSYTPCRDSRRSIAYPYKAARDLFLEAVDQGEEYSDLFPCFVQRSSKKHRYSSLRPLRDLRQAHPLNCVH